MQTIKEVTVFTSGNSLKVNTWSNVPYFFTETLNSREIKVNRVDLSPLPLVKNLFDKIILPLLKLRDKDTTYNYFRSYFHFVNVRNRINRAIKRYPNSDVNIFLTYSFSSLGLSNKPSVQFCDWTYEYHLDYFLGRKPDFFERQSIRRENAQVNGCDLIFSLFPGITEYMKRQYLNKNIYYLGNVINSLLHSPPEEILNSRKDTYNLLFVGGIKYISGALSLIKAFESLKQKFRQMNLHIIGMNYSDFRSLPADVYCYGYLDKGKVENRELYYKLFKEAKVFINTTPKWSAFSASLEALYFYIPVVITPYSEFIGTFSKEINFGSYCEYNDPTFIEEKIVSIINSKDYELLCYNAHNAVKEFTWGAYMDKLIRKIEEKIPDNKW